MTDNYQGLPPPIVSAGATGAGIKVAVVDTGVNFAHPHLSCSGQGGQFYWQDGEVLYRPGNYYDALGHGTCCAALVKWLAPGVELIAYQATDPDGRTDTERLCAALEQAMKEQAQIALVALGVRTRFYAGLNDVVREALTEEMIVVAADDPHREIYPARSPDSLAVQSLIDVDICWQEGLLKCDPRARPTESPHPSNFSGPSLSAARCTAALARFAQSSGLVGAELSQAFSKKLPMR